MDAAASFARDAGTAAYYEQRAPEYDEWYLGQGRFARGNRPGWDAEVADVVGLVGRLPSARTLDVGSGSGFLTRHLRGDLVVGVDVSVAMVALTRRRLDGGAAVVGAGAQRRLPAPGLQALPRPAAAGRGTGRRGAHGG